MAKKHVVIIGGGFAGVKSARKLSRDPNIEITLITNQDTFRYGATIWRASTGHLKEASYIPVEMLVPKKPNIHLVIDEAKTIDRAKRQVKTSKGKTYTYDYCIIGLGVVTSYFGIKGLEENSYSVKSSAAFDEFRKHLHEEVISENALDKNYVVVGAGPTGVELAAALRGYLQKLAKQHGLKRSRVNLQLVEAAPRVLPASHPKASRLVRKKLRKLGVHVLTKHTVKEESKNTLTVDKWKIPTHTVIWTAGVTCNPFFTNNPKQFLLNDKKRVLVDNYLRVDPHTFVIGDSAATRYSGLAVTALHNALYVSRFIRNDIKGHLTAPYQPLSPVTIIPLGDHWAVFQWHSFVFTGRFASVLRSIYDFVGYAEVMGFGPAYTMWRKSNKRRESCPHCQSLNS